MQWEQGNYKTLWADKGEGVLSWATKGNTLVVNMKHKSNLLDFSTFSNGDFLLVLPFLDPQRSMASIIFIIFHNIHIVLHLAKDHTLARQPRRVGSADERLETIWVGSSRCRGQDARPWVLQVEILNLRSLRVDGLAASVSMASDVTALAQIPPNNPVKAGTFRTKSFLPSAQRTEVLCHLGNFIRKQLEGGESQGPAQGDVEGDGGIDGGWAEWVLRLLRLLYSLA